MENDVKIMIAVISASSAIAGAVISQLVSIFRDILDKKHKRHILLREKYEELANLVTNSQEWFTSQLGAASLKELKSRPPLEARRAMVLSHIYFPLLQSACQAYVNASALFQVTLINNHEFVEGVDAGTQAAHKNRAAFEKAADNLQKKRQELDELIIKYACKYTKA